MRDVDLIEKLTGFVGSLCKRIRDWEFRHPWIARPFWYFIILVFVLGVCHGAFNYLNLYHTDADSARYMLSAMVQAQAAIIAIVITLTLIAVQLTASAYSPRVIRIFRNNPDMWLLLGCYGISMLYGLIVLKMVGVKSEVVIGSLGGVPLSFEIYVSFAYWLEAFTLAALFPYMLNITNLLKPESIIERLAIEINKNNIPKLMRRPTKIEYRMKSDREKAEDEIAKDGRSTAYVSRNPKEDPIQPIIDMIYVSIVKYDIATIRVGLKAITHQVIGVINSDIGLRDKEDISWLFCDHLKRVCRLASSEMDEESTREVIENLYAFWKSTVKKNYYHVEIEAVKSFGVVGKIVAESGFEDVTQRVVTHLEEVGGTAAKKEFADEDMAFKSVVYLAHIGKIAAERELEDVVREVASALGNVGGIAAESGFHNTASEVATNLSFFGKFWIERENKKDTENVSRCLEKVGTNSAEKGKEFRPVMSKYVYSGLFETSAATVTYEAAESLGQLGMLAVRKGKEFENVTKQVLSHLNSVGVPTNEPEFEWTTKCVARYFIDIGVFAVENGLDCVAGETANFLAKLESSALGNRGVEWAIDDGRYKYGWYGLLESQKCYDPFDKILNLYEHKLEKPHPRNSN